MQYLDFPTFAYKIRSTETGHQIFDVVRKKYVRLTAEEWVRQHLLHYLIGPLAYPRSLIRLEQSVRYNSSHHRPDIVAYSRLATPLLLIECKAPNVLLNDEVWKQIGRYNAHFHAPLLAVTNGFKHFCWRLDYEQGTHTLLQDIPRFDTLL